MNDLLQLSPDARYFLSQINSCVAYCHSSAVESGSGEEPVLTRLRELAESLIILLDSGEFGDLEQVVYDLRIDSETGDLRDLPAMLRATDEEIEQADREATATEDESDSTEGRHVPEQAPA